MNLKDWKIICGKIDLVFNSGVNFEKLKEIFQKNPQKTDLPNCLRGIHFKGTIHCIVSAS